jgi:hypothetical protein
LLSFDGRSRFVQNEEKRSRDESTFGRSNFRIDHKCSDRKAHSSAREGFMSVADFISTPVILAAIACLYLATRSVRVQQTKRRKPF